MISRECRDGSECKAQIRIGDGAILCEFTGVMKDYSALVMSL